MHLIPSISTIVWFGSGLLARYVAMKKGYNTGQWYYYTIVLGLIALIVLLFLPNKNKIKNLKQSDEIDYWEKKFYNQKRGKQ